MSLFLRYDGAAGTEACQALGVEFITSDIPDNSIVLDTRLRFDMGGNVDAPKNCALRHMQIRPSTLSNTPDNALNLWLDTSNGTTYVSDFTECKTYMLQDIVKDLGSSADSDLQSQLSNDWFGVGYNFENVTRDEYNRYAFAQAFELEVTYVPPSNVCVQETQNCFITIQAAINNATAYQTVVIVNDSYQYNENVVVNVTGLTLTSNTSTRPLIWSRSSQSTIKIDSDNIVISDLNIDSNSSADWTHVIVANGRNNITLRNNVISRSNADSRNNVHDISFYSTSFSNIVNNSIFSQAGNQGIGINITGLSKNIIIRNNNLNITGNGIANKGIFISPDLPGNSPSFNTIEGNVINISNMPQSGYFGMEISGSSGLHTHIIKDNIIFVRNQKYSNVGMAIQTDNTTIINNTVYTGSTTTDTGNNHNGDGIQISNADNVTLENNTIYTNFNFLGRSAQAIEFSNTFNSIINNNNASINGIGSSNYGIYLTGSNTNNVTNNYVWTNGTGLGYGIYLTSSSGNILNNNNITTGGTGLENYGIYILSGSSNNISSNIVSTNGTSNRNMGIVLSSSSSNNVSQNAVSTSGTTDNNGIYFWSGSSSNSVQQNTISAGGSSSNSGIRFESNSNFNIFQHNVVYASGTSNGNYGIWFQAGSDSNIFRFNNVTTNTTSGYGVYINASNNNTFYDSIITATAAYDVFLEGTSSGQTNYFVNSTFERSDIGTSASDVQTKLFVQNRLDVLVANSTGAMSDITVTSTDSAGSPDSDNPSGIFSETTNSSGYIPQQILTEFMANGTYNRTSGYLYFNNYVISTSSSFIDETQVLNITDDTLLIFTLARLVEMFGKGSDSYGMFADDSNENVYAFVNGENASSSLNSGWNHVAMTFESGTIKLYVNGRLVGTGSTSATPAANARSVVLGNGTSMTVDELAFRSGVLTQAAIEQHYRVGPGIRAIVSAVGSGSFGRDFDISASTSEGSFSNRHITTADLLAGTTQSVVLTNVTGVPATIVVTSNSCNQVLTATKAQLSGVYC